MNIEQELQGALRRKDPPAGFAERVAALAVAREKSRRRTAVWRPWLAMAASVVLMAGTVSVAEHYRVERHRQEALVARDKLITALRITRAKMEFTRQLLRGRSL